MHALISYIIFTVLSNFSISIRWSDLVHLKYYHHFVYATVNRINLSVPWKWKKKKQHILQIAWFNNTSTYCFSALLWPAMWFLCTSLSILRMPPCPCGFRETEEILGYRPLISPTNFPESVRGSHFSKQSK